ncbi:prostaglandin E2 receptor EP4 subtype-like [Aphis craccivora]|uniref:Prostaglandin E2 receptor EP4 subtype-like n=1 Tax=Aphis craccivora TaxID=307492 RepID=A0A6G0YLC6_APHCR|nr:prostaglandin E2 receptor EP4 subtype-like [Aphis craccivora]
MEPAVANATASFSSSVATTAVLPVLPAVRLTSPFVQIAFTGLSAFGVFGNLLALFILYRARSGSNQKHVFMLRCLATNDLIVLVGRVVHMFVNIRWPYTKNTVWSCRISVLWRFFGLNSGCVALMMAVERWLALTKPFFYRKVRSYSVYSLLLLHAVLTRELGACKQLRRVYRASQKVEVGPTSGRPSIKMVISKLLYHELTNHNGNLEYDTAVYRNIRNTTRKCIVL